MIEPYDVIERFLGQIPGRLRRQPKIDGVARGIARAFAEAASERNSIAIMLSDPSAAFGAWLDKWGKIVDEPRGGLVDREYRAIILGKIAALSSGGAPAGIAATWRALAFDPAPGAWRMFRNDETVEPFVELDALVDAFPSALYGERAASVLSLAIGTGIEAFGVLYVSGAFGHAGDPEVAPFDDASIAMTIQARGSAA